MIKNANPVAPFCPQYVGNVVLLENLTFSDDIEVSEGLKLSKNLILEPILQKLQSSSRSKLRGATIFSLDKP